MYISEGQRDRLLVTLLRGDVKRSRAPVDVLSSRQLEVFNLLGEGVGTRDIASRLHLSVKTVETHIRNMKIKLGVESSRELIIRASRGVGPDQEL
jgi:DNA-binding NarL/FixJ family response regulator